MRPFIYILLIIIVVILVLEFSITSDIAAHPSIDIKNTEIQAHTSHSTNEIAAVTYASNHIDNLDIASFIAQNTNHKQLMNYITTKSLDTAMHKRHKCNAHNWMNGLYQNYEPLNQWSFYDNVNVIHYKSSLTSNPAILIMEHEHDIDHNSYNISDLSTYKIWTKLSESSLLIRRIYDTQDIDLMGRFIEYLWAKNWMGHIRNDPRCTPQNDHCRDDHLKPVIVETVACWTCGCVVEKQTLDKQQWMPIVQNTTFYTIASHTNTDKVHKGHSYHKLYNKHLPKYYHKNDGVFLEIGLGCNMGYGPGESAKIWTRLFNHVQFIEYDAECTAKYKHMIDNSGYIVHVGSQDDVVFLEELKEIYWNMKGLDIVVDDGGHWNKHIITSFLSLWPVLNDNGLYFIEDFQESAYIIDYLDSKPITEWGGEVPGTAQYFIKKQLLYQLFCSISKRSCNDLKYIECAKDICVFKKQMGFH